MKRFSLLFIALLLLSATTFAQEIIRRDTLIENMLKEVSTDSLQSYIDQMVAFGTRSTLSTVSDEHRGIGAARRWVLDKFQSFAKKSDGRMTAKIDSWLLQPGTRVKTAHEIGNVMATLKGSDPADNRIFIVSGHLDSRRSDVMDSVGIAPGANDDASGVAAVLEMARIMSQHKFPATIIFVAVSGEEQGLYGSEHLAEEAKKNNWHIAAMLNNDIIGASLSSGTNIRNNTRVRVFSEGIPANADEKMIRRIRLLGMENDSPSRELARYMQEMAERYVPHLDVKMEYRNDRFLRGGDHLPFQQRGFTAVRMTEMNENFYHQHQDVRTENGIEYGDLPKFMDFEYLRKNTCLNLSTLANLDMAPPQPDSVKIDISHLTNDTHLYWNAPAVGHPAGYYVLVRETSAPQWQQKIFTTENDITIPYSKDNYFFAVEDVDAEGHESLPVFPGIGR